MCTILGERLWALVPTPARMARDALVELSSSVLEHVRRVSEVQLHAGIGGSVASVAQIPSSRRSAERVLGVIARRGPVGPHVAHADDLRAEILILQIVSLVAELPELSDGAVARLAAADPDQLRTLRAFLDAHGDIGAAAQTIQVHPNTMRYRMRRLQQTYGIDLADPETRLLASLEARVLERAAEPD